MKWLFLFIALIVATHYVVSIRADRRLERYFARFEALADQNSFVLARPRFYPGEKKVKEAVLLLHGYTGSPADFGYLSDRLREAGIPHYCPTLTGHSLGDMRHLDVVRKSDWIRDAMNGYALLSEMAEKVSVIGFSNGAVLAAYLSERVPVDHLIFLSPNLFTPDEKMWLKKGFKHKPFAKSFEYLLPYVSKPRVAAKHKDPDGVKQWFGYPIYHTGSFSALWEMQDSVDLTKMEYSSLDIFYGNGDKRINKQRLLDVLGENEAKYHVHKDEYEHNAFVSPARVRIADQILEILQ